MVTELKEVISKVEKLQDEEQRRIAKMLEDEIQLPGFQELNSTEKYDDQYLKALRDKAKKSWLGKINPDEWLKEVRGSYE